MARTASAKIVRSLAGPNATIFNDKCSNGDRSIKVWRWGKDEYKGAKKALEKAGLTVVITTHITTHYMGTKVVRRLRVTE